MKSDTTKREILANHWAHILTQPQRNQWHRYAKMCPNFGSLAVDEKRTGEEMFIICNLHIVK